VNQGVQPQTDPARGHAAAPGAWIVLSHPDYDRRLRSYTGSADPCDIRRKALAGFR
jgi:hypothetical protein